MHAKTDSEATSPAPSSPRSPRPAIYYVMSPSQPDAEKMSLGGTTPGGSPVHHHHHHHHHRYSTSPIHHSGESSTTRFSASLKLIKPSAGPWRKIPPAGDPADDEDGADDRDERVGVRCYVILFVISFAFLFSLFSLILWGVSRSYKPEILVKSVVFEFYNVQAGMDLTGVPTKMLSINSTVKITFRNPATFFGVHVSSSPLELYYSELMVASGQMREFYESRKSGRVVSIHVSGAQVPLYGGGSSLNSNGHAVVPLELTFEVRARANVLGELVKSKFYRHVRCSLHLRERSLGKRVLRLNRACDYH